MYCIKSMCISSLIYLFYGYSLRKWKWSTLVVEYFLITWFHIVLNHKNIFWLSQLSTIRFNSWFLLGYPLVNQWLLVVTRVFSRKYENNACCHKMAAPYWNSTVFLHNVVLTTIVLHCKFEVSCIAFRLVVTINVFSALAWTCKWKYTVK